MLTQHPLSEGRRISLVWHEPPAGHLDIYKRLGRTFAELYSIKEPPQIFALSVEDLGGGFRFKPFKR